MHLDPNRPKHTALRDKGVTHAPAFRVHSTTLEDLRRQWLATARQMLHVAASPCFA